MPKTRRAPGENPQEMLHSIPKVANSTVARAAEFLMAFTESKPYWTVQELAEHFDMPRSTTYRYVSTLRGMAFLIEAPDGSFQLGPRILDLSRIARRHLSIIDAAAGPMQELHDLFGETVLLSQRIGNEVISLDRRESKHAVTITVSRGQILPWPGAPTARVLLAFADPHDRSALMNELRPVKYTPKTVDDPVALEKELVAVAENGFAYAAEELDIGVSGIAAPIIIQGSCSFALSISAPSFRLTAEKAPAMAEAVKAAAKSIAKNLGR